MRGTSEDTGHRVYLAPRFPQCPVSYPRASRLIPDYRGLLGDLQDLLNSLSLLHPENLVDFGAIFQDVLSVFALHLGARSWFVLQGKKTGNKWRIS